MTDALDLSPRLPDGFRMVGIVEPTVEEDEADRSFTTVDEATVRLLRRETRIGLARGRVTPVDTDEPGVHGYDIPLILVVQTHPESTVAWSRLVLDLSPTPGATISDMSPSLVEGETPQEIETTLGANLTFSVAGTPLGVEAGPEVLRRRTVYCPRITSSGIGFPTAYWDFRASDREFLHVNEELRLLVRAPADRPVDAVVTLRTRVRPKGLGRFLRLSGKLAGIDGSFRLV
ncbi:hypothetical protein EDD98_4155 [Streptomyces sp. PanSC19]|uniref:hypothetical protein n=1 Tax=Streptomyces sp. PanSC19 TaxID=1520455 RepID=UPI000F468BEF|nr:hypothetical protein [Streptomyces sp. PanSC19]ROQ35101.1 hypothetical protein EDD98_4155 [Streptomyces sp. PanSC19]